MARPAEINQQPQERNVSMTDSSQPYEELQSTLHTYGDLAGRKATINKRPRTIDAAPCDSCAHADHCSKSKVACADFATYVDPDFKKHELIGQLQECDAPRLPLLDVYQLIFTD